MHETLCTMLVLGSTLCCWAEADDITIRSNPVGLAQRAWQRSLAGMDQPSERTLETLRRYGLEDRYDHSAQLTLAQLARITRRDPNAGTVYALAELNWIEGQRQEKRRFDPNRHATALAHYLDAAAYAYDYLLAPELIEGRFPSDPRFRLAIDLYNASVEQIVRAMLAADRLQPGVTIQFQVPGRKGPPSPLTVGMPPSPWKRQDVDEVLIATDFEVSGLPTKTHQYGLGVPLISVRQTELREGPEAQFYPPEMAYPLTAFLRPTSKLFNPQADDDARCTQGCYLDLVDPVHYRTVGPKGRALALESDLSTPLAYMWSRTNWKEHGWTGLLRPGDRSRQARLLLLRPFEPGKIPVVMVHGLGSNPLSWIPMLNELVGDVRIHHRYQFFLYVYPTGVPVPVASANLRGSLLQAGTVFNPDQSDSAFNQMVLLGHSMGGLLSHSMVLHSDDKYWQIITDRPFDEILGAPEDIQALARFAFFEPVPWVKRVVFLGTPHRGSGMSRGLLGKLGASLISKPESHVALVDRLISNNPDAFNRDVFADMSTSIETLDPDSAVLRALQQMRRKPDVALHSVIGSKKPGNLQSTTDGVVPYTSAHLENVASETIVRWDHHLQKSPQAIMEVRRILMQHLKDLDGTDVLAQLDWEQAEDHPKSSRIQETTTLGPQSQDNQE